MGNVTRIVTGVCLRFIGLKGTHELLQKML